MEKYSEFPKLIFSVRKKSGKFKTQYKITNATIDAVVDGGDESNLLLNGALVLGYQV